MKDKSLLYIHQYFNLPSMPGGHRSWEFSRRLIEDGWKIVMVTSGQNIPKNWHEEVVHHLGKNSEQFILKTVDVPYDNKMGFLKRVLAFLKFALKATLIVVKEPNIDLVFATSTPLTVSIPALTRKLLRRTPYVFEVRDLWPEMPVALGIIKSKLFISAAQCLEKVSYRYAERVIALSPGMKDGVVETGYPAERVVEVPNSSDIARFRNKTLSDELKAQYPYLGSDKLVVYAGSLALLNGVDYLAKVAEKMLEEDPDVVFAVFGKGAKEAFVRETAQKCGVLGKNFFLDGGIPKDQVSEVLSSATVACSLFIPVKEMEKNSANKFFDALAAGKPVAINYGGWQKEALESAEAGIALDPLDYRKAAKQLSELLNSKELLNKCEEGSKKLSESYSRDFLYKKFSKTLTDALK